MGTTPGGQKSAARHQPLLADALFTKGQQRVLGVLFGNPDRSFFATEIFSLAGTGRGAAQRELSRLESVGLVTVTRIGNQKHYQANRASPIFTELRGIVLKTAGLADVLRAALAPFARDIDAAFVFGSVAKQQDRSSSDIDVMILSDNVAYPDLFTAFAIAEERLGRKVNPTIYSPLEFARRRREKNAFLTRVLAQPKIWLIGGNDDIPAR